MQGTGKARGQPPTNNLASCIVATIFLVFVVIILLILFFSVFKPKEPKITVTAVQVPNFYVSSYPDLQNSTVNFTVSLYVSVKNPNRASFNYYESSVQLFYYGKPIGFVFIPAGKIMAGKSEYLCVTLVVKSFPFYPYPDFMTEVDTSRILPIQSTVKMIGQVGVLLLFTHHVEASANCHSNIAVVDGAVLAVQC